MIIKKAYAGTLESSDAYVEIESGCGKIEIEIESVVFSQFGEAIKASAQQLLEELGVKDAFLRINDRGALDCVLRARIETAVCRAMEVGK